MRRSITTPVLIQPIFPIPFCLNYHGSVSRASWETDLKCSRQEVGGELTSNRTVRKTTFSGPTEVGKLLMQQRAGTVKKLSLELFGNASFIVFDDADIEITVKARSRRNTGTPARVLQSLHPA